LHEHTAEDRPVLHLASGPQRTAWRKWNQVVKMDPMKQVYGIKDDDDEKIVNVILQAINDNKLMNTEFNHPDRKKVARMLRKIAGVIDS
jgi:hypothetical protein